jgi:mycothiol synthase
VTAANPGEAALPELFTDADVRVEVLGRLDPEEVDRVWMLIERATETDGVRPLSEHVALHLRHGGDDRVRNILLYTAGDRLAGYAHLDITDVVEGSSAELVVDPELRDRHLGRILVAHLLAETPDGRLRLWSHGEHPAAAALSTAMGFTRMRSLWQMRRSLFAPLPTALLPPGVRIRTFLPGIDDDAWLALNAAAFASHPEQGSWTASDLQQRMAEPWFSAEGFFLAERADELGRLVGFHWTKVHGEIDHVHGHAHVHEHEHSGDLGPEHAADTDHQRPAHPADSVHGLHGHEPIGEVYVVGVDPSEQGNGLGRALTLVGLAHLRALGLPDAMLYVDADNIPAIKLYTDLGFTRWDSDVMFRRA